MQKGVTVLIVCYQIWYGVNGAIQENEERRANGVWW